MEINWSTVGWIAALVFLYLFGFFEGRAKGYKKRQKEEPKEKESQPQPPPEPEKVTVTETVTVTVDDPGLLRVKNEGGSYTLDLDGARVDPSALPMEQRKRLIEILSIMRPWLEGRSAPPTPPTPPTASAPPPAPASALTSAHPGIAPLPQSSLLDRIQSKSAPSVPSAQTPPTPVEDTRQGAPAQPAPPPPPASPSPAAPKPATIAKEDRPASPADSMVEQIDSILQARLAGTPLEERGIFLTQSPEGGVNVYVGLTRYNGIDDILDPEIKAAIRAAITEWEHKFTPGLK